MGHFRPKMRSVNIRSRKLSQGGLLFPGWKETNILFTVGHQPVRLRANDVEPGLGLRQEQEKGQNDDSPNQVPE